MPAEPPENDPILDALDNYVAMVEVNREAWGHVLERIEQIRAQRLAGRSYTEVYRLVRGNGLLETVTANQERLTAAGSRLRRTIARVLHAEGMSVVEIGQAFGVSRQRVYHLLRDDE